MDEYIASLLLGLAQDHPELEEILARFLGLKL
jgi:hypothetical protein